MKKVSFVCTTFRRARCVERIISQYLLQDYEGDIELIIFNTDEEYPIKLLPQLSKISNIIVVNNNIDYKSQEPYTNRGDICRDAILHASGDYFMLADDDDYYLPWHVRQAVDGIERNGLDAWKPDRSFFRTPNKIELVKNTMEASVIVKMHRMRELGFLSSAGYEGLGWYTPLRDEGQLNENDTKHVSSYCFNWGDPLDMAGHKQSGEIDNPNNFENHKEKSVDKAVRSLGLYDVKQEHLDFFTFIGKNRHLFDKEAYIKYAKQYV